MDFKCRIADAMNTYNSALRIIKSKGYKIFLYPDSREEYYGDYWATKNGRDFIGGDPLRLLGVISIWENLGDDWRGSSQLPEEDIYDQIASISFPDSPKDFDHYTDKEFQNILKDYQIFFDRIYLDVKLSDNTTREEFFEIVDNFYKETE